MRKLIIKRHKTFVACIGKIKIYMEDNQNGNLDIRNIKCIKLGELKNGEEKEFEIPNEEIKIFAIWDKMSRNLYNDMYIVPKSEFDFHLYGKAYYNPTNGNPFRFDNNNNIEAIENRKKGNIVRIIFFIIAIIVGFIIGFCLV